MKNSINKHLNNSSNSADSLPVIAGVEITTDAEGRFNLNALHKASGLGANKAPAQWLRTQTAKSLIAELEKETVQICIVSDEGRNGGTFAHELLAIEYAGWISPVFRLQVNQTFLDFRTGKLVAVNSDLPDFSDEVAAARAWADEREAARRALGYVERQAKYIEHLENLFSPGMTPTQFCKRLNGVNVQQVTAFLEEHNWLYDDRPESRRPAWRVKAYARDLYLTERRHLVEHDDIDSFDTYTPVLLRKGAVWIYRQYLKGVLPMKKSWNGEFTHDKELAGAA